MSLHLLARLFLESRVLVSFLTLLTNRDDYASRATEYSIENHVTQYSVAVLKGVG